MNFPLDICSDESPSIRSDRTILDAVAAWPHMKNLSAQTPVAELGTHVKGSRHKRLPVRGPSSGRDRLPMVIDGQHAATSLIHS